MSDKFHLGTFVWGAVLTVAGAAMAAIGLGWWDVTIVNLGYLAPALVIVAGVVILVGALTRERRET
jgi:hypothetical protein